MEPNQKDQIRQAIVCREYARVKRLWTEYMDCLRSQLRQGVLTQDQMDEARELLDWVRVTVLCQRAHIQQRLRGLQVAGIYGYPTDSTTTGASFSGKL